MRRVLFFFIIVYLLACKNQSKEKTFLYDLSTAKDAFDYPNLQGKNDTDTYVYQLKDALSSQDSFLYVTYGSYYLKQFDEKNLSLRPLALETFRFSYCPFGQKPINITFNKKEIVIKMWTSGSLDRVSNLAKLDSLESIKFNFFEHYFFRTRQSLSEKRSKYYDSMLIKYPELKSVKYYKHLIDKSTDNDSLKFKYTTSYIPISLKQYTLLLDSLKKANFDKLSWRISSAELVNDGGGYTFEANTKTKFKFFVCEGMPIDTLPMTKFCRYLLKLANVDKETNL
jgi:hypothetical protein